MQQDTRKHRAGLAAHTFEALAELRAAFLFLTRLPVGWSGPFPDDMQRRCQLWFPAVGMVTGALAGAVLMAAWWIGLPPAVAVLLAIATQILITGGLHEDGLADVADGFGGGATRERKLEIMRDSSIGAYGMLALIIAVGLRAGGLLGLLAMPGGIHTATVGLVVLGAVSRACLPALPAYLAAARTDGVAAKSGAASPTRIWAGAAIGAAVAFLLLHPIAAAAVVAGTGAGAVALAVLARRQIGGYTGDVLGATQQMAEIAGLLALCVVAANG